MPGGEDGEALSLRQTAERLDFRHRHARRLFQHKMLAGEKGSTRLREPALRRRAQCDRIDGDIACQQRVDILEMRQGLKARMAAGDGDEFDAFRGFNGGQMLVARDLAEGRQGPVEWSWIHPPGRALVAAALSRFRGTITVRRKRRQSIPCFEKHIFFNMIILVCWRTFWLCDERFSGNRRRV